MKRINLTKYGFTRSANEDYSYNGTRYTCYRLGRVRVSKIIDTNSCYIYILGNIIDGKLVYEEYTKLPHYEAICNGLNKVLPSEITDETLRKFHDDCVKYEEEYTEAEKNSKFPSAEELKKACELVYKARKQEFDELKQLVTIDKLAKVFKQDKYYSELILNHYLSLQKEVTKYENVDNFVGKIINTPESKEFMSYYTYKINPSQLYTYIKELLNKYCK